MKRTAIRIFLLPAIFALFICQIDSVHARGKDAAKQTQKTVADRLIGVWEAERTSKGGLGAIYEFREDGGWVSTIGAIVELQGASTDAAAHPQFSEKGKETAQKIMEGPEGSAAAVGAWKYRYPMGGFAYERIFPDGRHMLRIPFAAPWGKYEIRGKTLNLVTPGCPPVQVGYRIIDDTELELVYPKDKRPLRLKRVQPTWYHALREDEIEEARATFQKYRAELDKPLQSTGSTRQPEWVGPPGVLTGTDSEQHPDGTKGYEILR